MFDVRDSEINGKGVFATSSIVKGAVVDKMFWITDSRRDEIEWPVNLQLSKMCWKVNHQAESNCRLVTTGQEWSMQTKRDIQADEELTIDYRTLPRFMDRDIAGFNELVVN